MEQSAFRLLVYAIVAAAVFMVFYLYIAPNYLWPEEPEEAVEDRLGVAETQLGKYTSQPAAFSGGYAAKADAFESGGRSIVFSCNNPALCCTRGEDCGKPVEWDNSARERYLSFKELTDTVVSARCRYEGLYICRVFVGEEPAQVEIKEMELDREELDLAEGRAVKAAFGVENTGKQDMIGEAVARVYKKQLNKEGGIERVLKKEITGEFTLAPGEAHSDELEIRIGENGDFEIEITVQEKNDKTNYEKESFELEAYGLVEITECVAGNMELQELEKCVYLLPCKCRGVVECENTWRGILGISIEEELELVKVDEENEEITLKYESEYELPQACDPETEECEQKCRYEARTTI